MREPLVGDGVGVVINWRRCLPPGLLAIALLASACGDPRLNFVGTWKGPMKTIVRFQDGSSDTFPKGEVTVAIAAPDKSDRVAFNGTCSMTATVNDDRTFTVNKKACPLQRITFPDTAGNMTIACDLVETVNGGTGTLATTSLTISYFGDSQVARCSDGINALATYTAEMTLTKQ